MSLYLVQHGINLPKEKDPDKSLSEQGEFEVKRMASLAKDHGIPVARIIHSGKKRAQQTAEIFDASLGAEKGVEEQKDLGPTDDPKKLAQSLDPKENLMVVGHLPFLSKLTSYLITGSTEKPVFQFQNSGILCLDKDKESDSWIIKWSLVPRIE